jgi:ArsR family transcriptional regulator
MLASAGIEISSSALYPNASATALTPAWLLDKVLVATAPYFDFTDSNSSVTCPHHICLHDYIKPYHICQGVYNGFMAAKQAYSIEHFFQALGDNTRLRLLNLMGDQEVCVCYFVEILGGPQPKVSRHLAYLRRAGIVSARRDGKWMHYRIVMPPHAGASHILQQTLNWLKEDRSMQADRAHLSRACCSPAKYPMLEGAPLPASITEASCGAR